MCQTYFDPNGSALTKAAGGTVTPIFVRGWPADMDWYELRDDRGGVGVGGPDPEDPPRLRPGFQPTLKLRVTLRPGTGMPMTLEQR